MLNETLRLFPPAITIPKQSAEDTAFTTTNAAGEKRTIPVPKGTFVTVHTPGLHNNRTSPHRRPFLAFPAFGSLRFSLSLPSTSPTHALSPLTHSHQRRPPAALPSPAKYWADPDKFDPSRFLRDYPRDAFLPFSGGPRGCIGRGFAETESVAVLTLLIARYRVELRHEPRFAHESFEERRRRLLSSKLSVTL